MRVLSLGLVSALSALSMLCVAQSAPQTTDSNAVFEHAKAATVIVLSGEGAGRLRSIATGAVISKDGTILTAWHAIKGSAEVQIRTPDGEVYDRVEFLGVDERRDIVALKISAGGLAAFPIGSTSGLAQGDSVYAVTNSNGLAWSATDGIISAVRPADEVPDAGTGFRLLQFTAPVAPGASGGALVDRNGALLGIIVRGGPAAAFAIPIESVMGLSDLGPRHLLGSGADLQMPSQSATAIPQSSAAIASADPKLILRNAKTVYLTSKTMFLTVDTVDHALTQQKDWDKLGLTIVNDPRVADLLITFDRPLFTYRHTFVITDKRTTIILGSGQEIAFDGSIASGSLAKDIVRVFSSARLSGESKKQ